MKQLLTEWLRCQKPITILGSSCEDSTISILYFDYLGSDGKFYSLGVAFTPTKILGCSSRNETLKLVGDTTGDQHPVDLFHLLDSLVVCYDTKEEWLRGRSKKINRTLLERSVSRKMQDLIERVSETEVVPFKVVGVSQTGLMQLTVSYSYKGRIKMPFSINLADPSLIKFYNYGEDGGMFVEFVKAIKNDIVWY